MANGHGSGSYFKHHRYKGMSNSQVARPDNFVDEDDPEERTLSEMRSKYRHLRNVTDGTSQPIVKPHSPDEVFKNVYPEFLGFYSRGQLQYLEKLFLMADQDRDGQLNSFEVKYWMEKHGNPISQREAKQIFKIADENKDGRLDFREFLLFCQKIELKDIPSDNQNINVKRMIEDPTGQSRSYPPRSPDDGVGKMASKLKSYAQIKGNIGNAIKYFEKERSISDFRPFMPDKGVEILRWNKKRVAFCYQIYFECRIFHIVAMKITKESESSQRNRQTYDAIMDHKRTYSRPRKTNTSTTEGQPNQNQRYRTSLNVQLAPVNGEHNQNTYISSATFYPNRESTHSNSSRLYRTSISHVPEEPQVYYRSSINMESNPENEQCCDPNTTFNEESNDTVQDCDESSASEWHPNVYRNTYKTSLSFLNNQRKLENCPPRGRESKPKYSFRHDKQPNTYRTRSTQHKSPRSQEKCDPAQTSKNNRQKDLSALKAQDSPLLGLTPSKEDTAFQRQETTDRSDDQIHLLKSGFSDPMAEQEKVRQKTPIAHHIPPPPPLPPQPKVDESLNNPASQYTKGPLVELFLNRPKTPSKEDGENVKSISVQTTFPNNDTILKKPEANTTAVQTNSIQSIDQSTDTRDIAAAIPIQEADIDSGFNTPINSEFALL